MGKNQFGLGAHHLTFEVGDDFQNNFLRVALYFSLTYSV